MNTMSSNPYIRDLYDFAVQKGFPESSLFGKENWENYIRTAIDAYRDYALFKHIFRGRYDEKTFSRMMAVDFKSRMSIMAGLASGEAYESITLLEPPGSRRTGMPDYFRAADLPAYTLLAHPEMYRLNAFERFARKAREPFLDRDTWYLYVFATQRRFQGMGHGKKLMQFVLSFANARGFRICLETNDAGNVALYRHFGFDLVHYSQYQGVLDHYVMRI